jgi:hypothetical protein
MAGFEIVCMGLHLWHVRRTDGLVEGVFTDQQAALRFARRESLRFARH